MPATAAMIAPPVVVLRSEPEEIEVIAKVVEVAFWRIVLLRRVDEARRLEESEVKVFPMVEDALEKKPPVSVARLETERVELRVVAPALIVPNCAPPTALKAPATVVEPVERRLVVVAPPEKSAVTKCEVDDATIPSLAQMTEVVAEVVVP